MIALYFIMLAVFAGYVGFIWNKYGVLPSISDSYYVLPKNINFLFTLFCWGFALPAMIVGIDLTDNFLMFLATGGICFVGAAAAFKDNDKTMHEVSAIAGVIFSQLSIAFDFKMYYVNAFFIIMSLIILLTNIKNKTWWLELVAFGSICYVLGKALF
jgi:hypothetical protein